MVKRYCDKCKRELPLMVGIGGMVLTVTVKDILTPKSVDLCPDCQREVYNFVFGEESKENDHDPKD